MPVVHRFFPGVNEHAQVVILECGSKSTPMIAQCCRELGITTWTIDPFTVEQYVKGHIPKAIIVSGGPDSVYDPHALHIPFDTCLMPLNRDHHTALWGICYGAQALAQHAGGSVEKAAYPEIGIRELTLHHPLGPYSGGKVVMNHSDDIVALPPAWECWGETQQSRYALFGSRKDDILATLFHPELEHTDSGKKLMAYFLYTMARCTQDYRYGPETFVDEGLAFIREAVPDGNVVMGVSGGVDSVTAFELFCRALGRERVWGVFVDNGFLRDGEAEEVRTLLSGYRMTHVDACELFYRHMGDIPWIGHDEEKYFDDVRRIIGTTFIEVFEECARGIPNIVAIGQGTNQGDIQETVTKFVRHHNVGGLPKLMDSHVVEPFAGLYKYEIRHIAAHLGIDTTIVWRQPSPGPGNAIRMWPPVTREKARVVGAANRVLHERIINHYPDPQKRPSQYYVGLFPGRMRLLVGDQQGYGCMLWVRAVKTGSGENYASAEVFHFPEYVWSDIEMHLRREVAGLDGESVAAVFMHGTGKPPAPIEAH